MEQWTAFVVAVGIIAFATMISSIFKSMNKIQPVAEQPDLPTNKWDVIDEELIRLHEELTNYDPDECPAWISQEISRLNTTLSEKGE